MLTTVKVRKNLNHNENTKQRNSKILNNQWVKKRKNYDIITIPLLPKSGFRSILHTYVKTNEI